MKVSKIICFAVGAMLAATAAGADETLIVSNILGPEGPLYIDGNLYYVGWSLTRCRNGMAKRRRC